MLLKRGATYYCRVWVPLDMRELIGRRELKKSLRTDNRQTARTAAKLLAAKAEQFFFRARAGVMTDRELEILGAELIAAFTGKVAEHKHSRKDVIDWLCFDGGPFPPVDSGMIETTLKSPKTPADVAEVVTWYTRRIEELEQEIATEFFSRQTRYWARRIVADKKLDVELPPAEWFNDPDYTLPPRYDAEFDTYYQDDEEPATPEEIQAWNSPAPPSFNLVCLTLLQAQIDAYRHELEKVQGKRNTPLQAQIAERIETAKPRPKLSGLWEEHRKEKEAREKWVESTKDKNSKAVSTTIEMLGDMELGRYSDADATRLIENMKRRKRSVSHINYTIELLSTLWIRAMKRPKMWHVEYNPWSEKQLDDNRNESELKDDYTLKEIEGLFRGLSTVRRLVEPEKFWVPLVALYSGMRLNEVCQLRTDDVEDIDGVLTFNIRHRPELNQEVKNKQDRTCPVHPTLLKLGFGRYLEEQRAKGEVRLFSNLTLWRGKWKRKIEGWYNRTFEPKFVSDADTKSFHSLRHCFCNKFKQEGLLRTRDDEYVLKSMVGHIEGLDLAGGLTLNRYGKAFPPKKQLALLKRLDYGVDLGLLEKKR